MTDARKATVAAGYDALGPRWADWRARVVDPAADRLVPEFEAAMPPGSSLVDLGCGTGVPWTRRLAERFRVTGVDISASQIDVARRNVPAATFLCSDVASVDVEAGSLDGVTAFHSICHLPREEHPALLTRIASWLRPGGLLLATLGADDLPEWTGTWLGIPMFFSSFDAETNRALVEAAGFDLLIAEIVDSIEPEGAVPFLWVLARRRSDVSRG